MRFRTVLLAAVSLALAAAPAMAAGKAPETKHHKVLRKAAIKHAPPRARHEGVSVVMDEVRVVTFKQPVSTVFVGNSIIADATVIDPYHAFILGKAYGVTNLIALSAQRQTIVDQQITVANRSGGVVTLNKGAAQFTYACTTAHCETNPRPGDQKAYYDDTQSAVTSHQDQSIKAASAAQAH
jgi:Pilus formation protein N terminal region